MTPLRALWTTACVTAGVVLAEYLAVAASPLFSESYSHYAATAKFDGPLRCFDPELMPLRPLQHLFFWIAAYFDISEAWLLRVPAFGMHWLSCLLTFALARQLGATPRSALLAATAFALFPNVKSLYWVAAIGWPGRVLFMLAAATLFFRHRDRPSPWSGAGLLCCFALALLWNQGAIVLPGLLLVLALARRGWRDTLAAVRDPWLAGFVALAVAYFVYVALLRTGKVHSAGLPLSALLANTAKAFLSVAPQFLRNPALEGLRAASPGGIAVAAGVGIAVGLPALQALRRGPAMVRALLICLPIELLPAVLSTGFVPRYAYLASALLAISLALAVQHHGGRGWYVVLLLPGVWIYDSTDDLREIRAAGREITHIVTTTAELRAEIGPEIQITIADVPTYVGADEDITVLNWGLREALARRGADGNYDFVRTHGHPWPDASRRISAAELDRIVREGRSPLFVFDLGAHDYRRVR